MNRPRLTVFLMMQDGYLKKSKKFSDYVYIGDPLNTVRIFSDFEVDEITIVDVNATKKEKDPDYDLLKNIASFTRMPMCYGGGINNLLQIEKIIELGIEKVSICSALFDNKKLIKDASNIFGSQSIVGCIDIRYSTQLDEYEIYIKNGSTKIDINIEDAINLITDCGVGEILINNIDLDGTYKGFDSEIISRIVEISPVPVTALGGASSKEDIKRIWTETNVSGVAAGSLWSFIGKNDTVLLNYPNPQEKQSLFSGGKKR